jgi:hypothetical protein
MFRIYIIILMRLALAMLSTPTIYLAVFKPACAIYKTWWQISEDRHLPPKYKWGRVRHRPPHNVYIYVDAVTHRPRVGSTQSGWNIMGDNIYKTNNLSKSGNWLQPNIAEIFSQKSSMKYTHFDQRLKIYCCVRSHGWNTEWKRGEWKKCLLQSFFSFKICCSTYNGNSIYLPILQFPEVLYLQALCATIIFLPFRKFDDHFRCGICICDARLKSVVSF